MSTTNPASSELRYVYRQTFDYLDARVVAQGNQMLRVEFPDVRTGQWQILDEPEMIADVIDRAYTITEETATRNFQTSLRKWAAMQGEGHKTQNYQLKPPGCAKAVSRAGQQILNY